MHPWLGGQSPRCQHVWQGLVRIYEPHLLAFSPLRLC